MSHLSEMQVATGRCHLTASAVCVALIALRVSHLSTMPVATPRLTLLRNVVVYFFACKHKWSKEIRQSILVDGDIPQVEGIHGVAAEAVDVLVGEVEHLVVVEDDDGGVAHVYL